MAMEVKVMNEVEGNLKENRKNMRNQETINFIQVETNFVEYVGNIWSRWRKWKRYMNSFLVFAKSE